MNPPNAVIDDGIDLKRKPSPPVMPAPIPPKIVLAPPTTFLTRDHIVIRICRLVAKHYDLTLKQLLEHRRQAPLVKARCAAVHVIRAVTDSSLPDIGRRLANRDHTTILNNLNYVKKRAAFDPVFAAEISSLESQAREMISAG